MPIAQVPRQRIDWDRLAVEDVPLLQLASVRYLLSVRSLRGPLTLPYTLVSSSQGIFVYEAEDALLHAYTVPRARIVADVEGARKALLDPRFDLFRELVLVGEAGPAGGGGSDGVASLAWRRDEAKVVELEASLPAPGHLVLPQGRRRARTDPARATGEAP